MLDGGSLWHYGLLKVSCAIIRMGLNGVTFLSCVCTVANSSMDFRSVNWTEFFQTLRWFFRAHLTHALRLSPVAMGSFWLYTRMLSSLDFQASEEWIISLCESDYCSCVFQTLPCVAYRPTAPTSKLSVFLKSSRLIKKSAIIRLRRSIQIAFASHFVCSGCA